MNFPGQSNHLDHPHIDVTPHFYTKGDNITLKCSIHYTSGITFVNLNWSSPYPPNLQVNHTLVAFIAMQPRYPTSSVLKMSVIVNIYHCSKKRKSHYRKPGVNFKVKSYNQLVLSQNKLRRNTATLLKQKESH